MAKAVVNQDFEMVVANVYGPNTDSPDFFETVKNYCLKLAGEDLRMLIVGDLNVALDSELDTFHYRKESNVNARNRVIKLMHDNNMLDVFREKHRKVRRYTWRVRRPSLNPRPGRAFSITRPGRVVDATPPGVSKLSVVALRQKHQSIALDEYSRLVVHFYPRSTFDLVMAGQRSIFGEIDVFSTLQDNSNGTMEDIAMKPLPSCLVDNWHHFDI